MIMERPKVGVGVLIHKEGKFLFGFRMSAHGSGTWCPPGGHLEAGESFKECARREVLEETGVEIHNIRVGTVTNDIFEEDGKHYITVNMLADWKSGEPRTMEPGKLEDFTWFSWDNLPEDIFLTVQNMKKQGFRPEGI
jgi:8-oxo-dGTP diphosphatase